MKLATYVERSAAPAGPRIGVVRVEDGVVVDLLRARELGGALVPEVPPEAFADMIALLRAGEAAMAAARRLGERPHERALLPLDAVRLLAPVPRPNSLRAFSVFEGHALNSLRTAARLRGDDPAAVRVPDLWYRRPTYYKGNPMSVVGPEQDVIWPAHEPRLDYELELACVIGRQGTNIPAAEAGAYIAGYTIFNDVSARDTQIEEMRLGAGPAKGKDFDTGNPMGPYLVTPDEVGDAHALTMVARVDGEEWSRGSSAGMHFTFEQLIEYVSRDETLYPGDCFGSGAVTTGCGLEQDRWLTPGATIELEIERLGLLRNRVVKRPSP